MSNPSPHYGMKIRQGTVDRYRVALNDMVVNPGLYSTGEWIRKHGIGSQAVASAMRLGIVRKDKGRLFCERSVIRVETIEAMIMEKRKRDMEFGAKRLGKYTPPPARQLSIEVPAVTVAEATTTGSEVSILWGLFKWKRA